jgi:hypothetical protein
MNMPCPFVMGMVKFSSLLGLAVGLLVGSFGLVDQSPLLPFRPCPFIVSLLLGKCLATAITVRSGHDANCLFFTTANHVDFVGKHAAVCRYQMSSGCDFNS